MENYHSLISLLTEPPPLIVFHPAWQEIDIVWLPPGLFFELNIKSSNFECREWERSVDEIKGYQAMSFKITWEIISIYWSKMWREKFTRSSFSQPKRVLQFKISQQHIYLPSLFTMTTEWERSALEQDAIKKNKKDKEKDKSKIQT